MLVIIIIAIVILTCGKQDLGNINANLNNIGFSVQKGNWIYFKGYKDGSEDGIYRLKNKKTEKIADDFAIYLNVYKNNIYYIDVEEENIIKIDKNGKNREIVLENVDLEKIMVLDNWIYYFDDAKLYKIKTNGKDKIMLLDKSIENYEIIGKWIYYTYKNNGEYVFAKITTNGKDDEKIDSNIGKNFFVKGNYIYYIYENYNVDNDEYNYELYKMKINGKNKEKIIDIDGEVDVDTINFYNNKIYYAKENEKGKLAIYKINLKGKDETKIVNLKGYITNINIHNNWIYYPDQNDSEDVQINRVKINGKVKEKLSI